jgi:3-hydroxyacyl-CoA dehydrogenase
MTVLNKKIDKIIDKGGSISSEKEYPAKYKVLSQKIRADVLKAVDKAVFERPGMTRCGWIQEAISEKLKRKKDVHED